MTAAKADRATRVIQADGWPGGPRIIEGLRPTNCIHRRPLRSQDRGEHSLIARENLCRLCVYEAPRLARMSSR